MGNPTRLSANAKSLRNFATLPETGEGFGGAVFLFAIRVLFLDPRTAPDPAPTFGYEIVEMSAFHPQNFATTRAN
jgi:hypothetical protein